MKDGSIEESFDCYEKDEKKICEIDLEKKVVVNYWKIEKWKEKRMTKKERDKLYKIIEIFHNKYYEVNERNISDFYKEIHVMFPTITQNDINWAFEKYLWKKEFKFKKLASILTMLFMLPLQLWAIKIIDVNGISLLFLLIPEIIAMFILAWFMMKEMIIEEKYK